MEQQITTKLKKTFEDYAQEAEGIEFWFAREHVQNNTDVRKLLAKSGIKPEELLPEKDLQKMQRKVKSEEEKIAESSKRKMQKRLG
ncbi:hypothetical protein HYX14_00540 [Candidatus Woesearchaeota archaeon]|nr:hypothetical protein [Candidatus Woesearchaeota archaeon]